MFVVDGQGIIRFSNETSSSLFGYTSEHLIGQPNQTADSGTIPYPARVACLELFVRTGKSRMLARISDLFARRADGSEFLAGVRLSPFNDDGQSFVAAAIRDMTERRLISDALVAAREEADRANRAKSRFLATASHDLRQPLQPIRLINASMRKLTQHSPDFSNLVQHQEVAIDSATRLLNALRS